MLLKCGNFNISLCVCVCTCVFSPKNLHNVLSAEGTPETEDETRLSKISKHIIHLHKRAR